MVIALFDINILSDYLNGIHRTIENYLSNR